jgi:glycerol-3-phosphate dehydrogenase
MDDLSSKPTIRPSQGVHIVLDNSFLRSQSAIMIPKTDDGRVLFAIPWYDRVVVGTTDTPLDEVILEPRALSEEVEFILNTARRYLTKQPSKEDILTIFAGLRPLAADPDNPESTKEVSRRHKISLSKSGLLSIVGGKWTSYRRMAEETIDAAIKAGLAKPRRCITKNFRLYIPDGNLKSQRLGIYGNRASEIEKAGRDDPSLKQLLHPDLPYTKAEIIWICQNEMPLRLEDILARRTRALFLDVRASIIIAPVVAALMAGVMGFSDNWIREQVDAYNELVINYL